MKKGDKRKMNQVPKISIGSTGKTNLNHSVAKTSRPKKGSSSRNYGPRRKQKSLESEFNKSHDCIRNNRRTRNINFPNGREERNYLTQRENGVSTPIGVIRNHSLNDNEPNENGNGNVITTIETTNGGKGKKPFRPTGLLNKSQLKLASFIKHNRNVKLSGTKRFADKSGEYYLKNVQLQNSRKERPKSKDKNKRDKKDIKDKRLSLNIPTNLEKCLKSNVNKLKNRANKIVTVLPENSLTPIPIEKEKPNQDVAGKFKKKKLKDAERTAVFIRRMEYATSMKRHLQMKNDRNLKSQIKKIIKIQDWWKMMFKIIKIQKNLRGFLFRIKLMDQLEHQENLLQFISEFENTFNNNIYKEFFDNLQKKADYELALLMEKCEDLAEKLNNLERLRDLKNFKKCFNKWKKNLLNRKKNVIESLAKILKYVIGGNIKKIKKQAFNNLKDKIKKKKRLQDGKVRDFKKRKLQKIKKKFIDNLTKAHRLYKLLNDVKQKKDKKFKKDVLDKLKNKTNVEKGIEKLEDFEDKKISDKQKKFMDKLKDIRNKSKMKDALDKWKKYTKNKKDFNKIFKKLIRQKKNQLKKKNKLAVESKINNFEVFGEKKPEPEKPKNVPIFISNVNDINIIAPEKFNPSSKQSKKLPKINNDNVLDQLSKVNDNIGEICVFYLSQEQSEKQPKIDNNNIIPNLQHLDEKLRKKEKFNIAPENSRKCPVITAKVKLPDLDINKKETPKKYFKTGPEENERTLNNKKTIIPNELSNKEKFNNEQKPSDKMEHIAQIYPPELDEKDKYKNKFKISPEESEKYTNNKKHTISEQLKDVNDVLRNKEKYNEEQKPSDKMKHITPIYPPKLNEKGNPKKDIFEPSSKGSKGKDLSNKKTIPEQLKNIDDALRKKNVFNIEQEPSQKLPDISDLRDILLDNIPKKNIRTGPEEDEKIPEQKKRKIQIQLNDVNDAIKKNKLKKLNLSPKPSEKMPFSSNESIEKQLIGTDKNKDKDKDEDKNKENEKDNLKKDNINKDINKNKENEKNNLKNNNNDKDKNKNRRISCRKKPKKNVNSKSKRKKKKKENKKLMKHALEKWRENAKELNREVLNKIKKNKSKEKNDSKERLKRHLARLLLNIFKKFLKEKLRKVLDKWKKINNRDREREREKEREKEGEGEEEEEEEGEREIIKEKYQPKHKKQSRNINKNPYLNQNQHSYRPDNKIKKYIPFIRSFKQLDPSDNKYSPRYYFPTSRRENTNEDEKVEQISDTTSANESDASVMTLVEESKIVKKSRDYIAQSFFIDKNKNKLIADNYKYNGKKIPSKLKGDFASLIEKNPNILNEKNPRIQVLNSTCRLNQIIDDENDEMDLNEIDNEINKLKTPNNRDDPRNNKILKRVVRNCDSDIYPKKDTEVDDKWISTSIPVNNKKNRFTFLKKIKDNKDDDTNSSYKFENRERELIAHTPQEKLFENKVKKCIQNINISFGKAPYRQEETNNTGYYNSPPVELTMNNDEENGNMNSINMGKNGYLSRNRNKIRPRNIRGYNTNKVSSNTSRMDNFRYSMNNEKDNPNYNSEMFYSNDYDDYNNNNRKGYYNKFK